jgi:hypothetical protein
VVAAPLTPSQMTALVVLGFAPPDERIEAQQIVPRIAPGDGYSPTSAANLPIAFIVASAVLGLADEGCLTLEYVRKKRWGLLPANHVKFARVSATEYPPGSVERDLAGARDDPPDLNDRREEITQRMLASRLEKARHVRGLAEAWFRSLGRRPAPVVMRRVEAGLVAGGWLTAQPAHAEDAPRRHRDARAAVQPDRDAIAAALPDIAAWVERLTGPNSLGELRPHVVDDVHRALNRATTAPASDFLSQV